MKNFLPCIFVFVFFYNNSAQAQSPDRLQYIHNSRVDNGYIDTTNRTFGTSGTGANIDVIYHKVFWRVNPDSAIKYIKGFVQTNFKTLVANVSSVTLDMNAVLIADSVKFGGALLPAGNISRSGNIITINLGVTLPENIIDSLIIFYQGIPPAVAGAAQGYQLINIAGAGNVINTLSESYEDRDWWPCKHDMQDKIDSMDITVSVPWWKLGSSKQADTFWVASNGRLTDSTIINDSSRIFTFKTRYPIASYLVAISVAKYKRFYRTANANGTIVPVTYNILQGKPSDIAITTAMDIQNIVLEKFSAKMGDYPFKLEKHGFYDGLAGAGGMEHQTFSAIDPAALQNQATLAHELTHQWFGDNVTFANWNDIWLAEGFARYGEALAAELVSSTGLSVYGEMSSSKSSAIANITQSAWLPNANVTTSAAVWTNNNVSAIYNRGAMVISMLRAMCGDQIFFSALTKYQTDLKGKSATTDTLKNYFNRELGKDISVFFTDYVGGSGLGTTRTGGIGLPTNTIEWNNPGNGNRLIVSVKSQTRTAGSNVTYFRGPIQLHIKGALAANDTTITIFDWGSNNLSYAGKGISLPIAGNRLSFDLSFVPTTVLYDDSARTMSVGTGTGLKTGTSKITTINNYVWQGTTNTAWATATNWLSSPGLPPSGADITIATIGTNQPILPTGNTTVGPLTINGSNTILLNGNTLIINNEVRGTGTISGSSTSKIVVADQAGTLNFTQTSVATRSLSTLTLNAKATATIGVGLLEIFGGLILPTATSLTVKSALMLIH